MGLYENVRAAAKAKGYSINRPEKELGFARSYVSKFKTITPSADKIQKIADFLDVSSEYLLTGENASKSADIQLTRKDEKDIARRLESTLEELENSQDGLMFSGEPLDDETRELLKSSLENSIRIAKINAKQKFTPKKYRKDQ